MSQMASDKSQVTGDKSQKIGTSICMFFVVGMFRSQGILFVEFIDLFGSSYALSSWMVGITACGMSVFSPLANYLAVKYSSRRVVMAGSLLCALAALATAWAPNIYFVICVFGGLTGMGYALMFGPSLSMIGLYFERRRSLANGLSLAGASMGCLVLPPLITLTIQHYTVWGALIVYSAFILNGFVAAMLLRPVTFYRRNQPIKSAVLPNQMSTLGFQKNKCQSFSLNDISKREYVHIPNGGSEAKLDLSGKVHVKPVSVHNGASHVTQSSIQSLTSGDTRLSPQICSLCDAHVGLVSGTCPQSNPSLHPPAAPHHNTPAALLKTKNLLLRIDDHYTSKESLFVAEGQNIPDQMIQEELKLQRNSKVKSCNALHTSCDHASNEDLTNRRDSKDKTSTVCSKLKEHVQGIHLELFTNPLFVIYVISCSLGNSAYVDHYVIVPPHAEDIGISKSQTALILSLTGAADLIARVLGGWFADLNLIKRSTLMSVAMVMTGVSTSICSFFPTYPSLVVSMLVLGCVSGVQVAVFPTVLIDFLGLVTFPSAFGLFMMVQGSFNTAFPPFLGWLKDVTGSYSCSFLALGVTMVLAGAVVWLEPCARRYNAARRQRREEG